MNFSKVFVIVFFILSAALLKAQTDECAGVVTGVNGTVHVRKARSESLLKANWGYQLFAGDQVITEEASEVTITLPNNSVMKLGPGSIVTISSSKDIQTKAPAGLKKISSASVLNLDALTSRKEKIKESGALAGLRDVTREKTIRPEQPYNTLVRNIRPSFAWTAANGYDAYTISLFNSSGLVWKKSVKGTSMDFPESEKDLLFGQSYFWNIEAEGLVENVKSDNYKFSIVTSEKAIDIENQENEIRNSLKKEDESSSLHSVLGAFYVNQGLIHEAIREFGIIASINPDSAVLHEILGSLYNEMGNKDKAIEELQKALSLTKVDNY